MKENVGWQYMLDEKWQNKELVEYQKIRNELEMAFD